MSDNLRTRIAAALRNMNRAGRDPVSFEGMADAVIEALDRDYIIVTPGTPLAQRIAQWQLTNWDGHWEGLPDD